MDMNDADAWSSGYQAGVDGKGRNTNPHKDTTNNWADWDDGWIAYDDQVTNYNPN